MESTCPLGENSASEEGEESDRGSAPIHSAERKREGRRGGAMKARERGLAPLVFVALVLSLPIGGALAQGGVSLRAKTWFDGKYLPGRFAPVFLEVENRTGREVRGTLSVEVSQKAGAGRALTVWSREVPLPVGSRQGFEFPVYLPTDWCDVLVSFAGPGAPPKLRVPLSPAQPGEMFVLVVSSKQAALQHLSGLTAPVPMFYLPSPARGDTARVRVQNVLPSRLPGLGPPRNWQSLEVADVVVWHDASPSALDRRQLEALASWVKAGGTLVVVGGPHWQVLKHPALRPLLPGDVAGSFEIRDWGELAGYVPGGPPRGPALAVLLKPERGAHVLLDVAGRPFLVTKKLGNGRVLFVAADLSEPPLRGWRGADTLWWEILAVERPPSPEDVGPSAGRGPGLASALMAIPVARPPSPWLLLAFLALYVLLLVPVNYLVLKGLDKLEWMWLTVPAVAVLFTVGAYGLAWAIKGGRSQLVVGSVVYGEGKTSVGMETCYLGLYSAEGMTYRLVPSGRGEMPRGLRDRPSGERLEVRATGGGGWEVADFRVPKWSMRVAAIEGLARFPKVEVRFTRGRTLEVVNRSGRRITGCYLVSYWRKVSLPPLEPGRPVKVVLPRGWPVPTGGLFAVPRGASPEERLRASLLNALFGEADPFRQSSGRYYLVWAEKGAEPPSVEPKVKVAASCTVYVLLPQGLPKGKVEWHSLPFAVPLKPWSSVECPFVGMPFLLGPEAFMLAGPHMFVAFLPPARAGVRPKSLKLSFFSQRKAGFGMPLPAGIKGLKVEAFDFSKGRWEKVKLSPATRGRGAPSTRMALLTMEASLPPERFVHPKASVVRFKVQPPSGRAISWPLVSAELVGPSRPQGP